MIEAEKSTLQLSPTYKRRDQLNGLASVMVWKGY